MFGHLFYLQFYICRAESITLYSSYLSRSLSRRLYHVVFITPSLARRLTYTVLHHQAGLPINHSPSPDAVCVFSSQSAKDVCWMFNVV